MIDDAKITIQGISNKVSVVGYETIAERVALV